MFEIIHPAETDVLCGKDKTFAKHPGNVLYRNLIQAFSQVYAETPTKQEKMRMTAEIVQKMKVEHGSRFLKSVHGNHSDWGSEDDDGSGGGGGVWEEISVTAARDKTSHALRFCAANPHNSYTTTAGGAVSSSSTNTPTTMAAPPRRSMRARRRRLHRRTVSSEKAIVLPYTTLSSDYEPIPPETYSLTDYSPEPQSRRRHFESNNNNSNRHYQEEAVSLSYWYDQGDVATPDAVESSRSDHYQSCLVHNLSRPTTTATVTHDCTTTTAAFTVTPPLPVRSTTATKPTSTTTRSAAPPPPPLPLPPPLSDEANEEDLDAILREPLNWEEMEQDDFLFL
jgi:hypothetical protein